MKLRDRSDRRFRRRLTLFHDGARFLDRWGLVHDRIGGFYIHRIVGPDPGLDLHDHPWSFISVVLWGGYSDDQAIIFSGVHGPPVAKAWGRWAGWRNRVHRMPLTVAHRITYARKNTWTLVLRGPTRRVWGFYPPEGRVEWNRYDYETRRPSTAQGNSIRGDVNG